jgi:hypothetical protein
MLHVMIYKKVLCNNGFATIILWLLCWCLWFIIIWIKLFMNLYCVGLFELYCNLIALIIILVHMFIRA